MRPEAYFVSANDCGEDLCDTCAGQALVDYVDTTFGHLDGSSAIYDINAGRRWGGLDSMDRADVATADAAVRRLRAAVRYCGLGDATVLVWQVEATLRESEAFHPWGDPVIQRCADALSIISQNFRGYSHWEDISDTHGGVWCDGCSTQLQAPWVICRTCGHDDSADNFGFVDAYGAEYDNDDVDSPHVQRYWDGLTVERCTRCIDDDDYGALPAISVLLQDDGRGYTLRFGPSTGIYSAGCRRFNHAQALAHWGDPTHYAPESARRLFRAVELHHKYRRLGDYVAVTMGRIDASAHLRDTRSVAQRVADMHADREAWKPYRPAQ